MAANSRTASLLLFPFPNATKPEKLKWIFTQSFRNMLTIIFCLAVWLIGRIFHALNTFLPSYVSALADISRKGEKGIVNAQAPNSLVGIAIGRALNQVLALVIETPVNSRKYDFVRALADKMIEENLKNDSLKEVNRTALSAGFGRTVKLLISALRDQQTAGTTWKMIRRIPFGEYLNKHLSTANDSLLSTSMVTESVLAEKLVADLLWFAEKLEACCGIEEAIAQWSEAGILANLSMSANPRVQGSLVRVSVYLLKEVAKEETEERKVKMMMIWMPLLANAANGVESVVLSAREKSEVERVVEQMIQELADMKDKEAVLANWLHHYARSNSDWPNLQTCYNQWCGLSRSTLC
ncbi:hypothetical protein SUGI_0337970 [Cryptomeria japonica]|nr:hypothetical protein SUGI_0337970 [Cryptomeria japonica]